MKKVAELFEDKTIVDDEKLANSLHSKGSIGVLKNNRLELSLVETLFLLEKGKIKIVCKGEALNRKVFVKKAILKDKRFYLRYSVYKDLKKKGHVVKTALKYGFDYRVYDKGVKPGQAHASWLVHCFNENGKFTWKDYSKMMRVAHSVHKKALMAIVDDESDVTYWESKWLKL